MNNHEISVPHLDMTEDVKLAILEAIRSNAYYGYACVFYYMYMNDLALLSEDNDLWAHKIDTEDNKWVIVDKSFVVNLYKDSIIREFGKLVDYYQAQVTHESCPYSQTIDNLTQSVNTMKHYGSTIVDEASQFFQVEDFKHFITTYLTHENLIDLTSDLFKFHNDI